MRARRSERSVDAVASSVRIGRPGCAFHASFIDMDASRASVAGLNSPGSQPAVFAGLSGFVGLATNFVAQPPCATANAARRATNPQREPAREDMAVISES